MKGRPGTKPSDLPRSRASAEFEEVIREYGGSLISVARRVVRNEDDAHECVQEAYARAFKNLESFKQQSAMRTWLHRIVINTCTSTLRSRIRRSRFETEPFESGFDAEGSRLASTGSPFPSPDTFMERKQLQAQVREAIESLPDKYHSVLLLRDIEGYSTNEVADMLDISAGTVKTRLHRARKALKKNMESQFSAQKDYAKGAIT